MIGNFTIPVGDLIKGLREERQREVAAIEKIVEWLTKISKDEMVASYYAHKEKVQAGIVDDDTNDELDSKIAQQRLNEKQKAKLIGQFAGSPSINQTTIDPEAFLNGDSNEEQRLKNTMEQKQKALN